MPESPANDRHPALQNWLRLFLPILVAGAVAYFTAQAGIESRISVLEERESQHYDRLREVQELLRAEVLALRADIHNLRVEVRAAHGRQPFNEP